MSFQISDLHNRGHIIGAHSSSHHPRMTALSMIREKERDNSTSRLSTIIGEPITEIYT